MWNTQNGFRNKEKHSQLLYNLVLKKLKLLKNIFISKLCQVLGMGHDPFVFFRLCATSEEVFIQHPYDTIAMCKGNWSSKNVELRSLISVSNNLVGNPSLLLFYTALSTYMCFLYNWIHIHLYNIFQFISVS